MPTEKVYALIPHRADSELHVLDSDDNFPSMERGDSQTFEGTLHAIGEAALESAYLSVNTRRTDVENGLRADDPKADVIFVYETQPLPDDIKFKNGYKWGYREEPTK